MAKIMTVGPGASLPRISFAQIGALGAVSWNQGTMASATFVPHPEPCPECDWYRHEFATAAEGLREWATRPLLLVGADGAGAADSPAPPGLFVLDDSAGRGRAALGLAADQAAVVQADRWGAVYQVATAGPGAASHAGLPAPHDLVALAQYIDIQCPECGVPSKEWLAATPFPLG